MQNVLTIAGSDSGGGAGIQGDLKTMCALGVYGLSVITAVTAQNTMGVFGVQEITTEIIAGQMQAIINDIPVDAIKIGMLSSPAIIQTVAANLAGFNCANLVLDPVMIAKSGYPLLLPEAVQALRELLPKALIVTPNIPEAEVLAGISIETENDAKKACQIIQAFGVPYVLLKGGHAKAHANDLLLSPDGSWQVFAGQRIDTKNTHGTGCALSAAIASYLAQGQSIAEAINHAKQFITLAIQNSFAIGHGVGQLGHLIDLYQKGLKPLG